MFRNPVTDLILVAVLALLIFGPKRLPMLGRSLGHGLREFKDGITGQSNADDDERPALAPATASDSAPAPAPPAAAAAPVASSSSSTERESAEAGSAESRP